MKLIKPGPATDISNKLESIAWESSSFLQTSFANWTGFKRFFFAKGSMPFAWKSANLGSAARIIGSNEY